MDNDSIDFKFTEIIDACSAPDDSKLKLYDLDSVAFKNEVMMAISQKLKKENSLSAIEYIIGLLENSRSQSTDFLKNIMCDFAALFIAMYINESK